MNDSRNQADDQGPFTLLTRDTAAAWEMHRAKSPQNAGLIFDRFASIWTWERDDTLVVDKPGGLKVVKDAAVEVERALITSRVRRWNAVADAVQAEPFTLSTDWRLVTGMGRKGPLEVGFAFDRYGLATLPGSGLKGLARSRAFFELADALGIGDREGFDRLEKLLAEDDVEEFLRKFRESYPADESGLVATRDLRAIFGTVSASGGAVFLDAIPERTPRLDLDIMNPHVPDYYRAGSTDTATPPTNWQNPVPVYFLAVAAGTPFRFGVGWRGPLTDEARRRRTLARRWLTDGLTELGAGGKTGAGYGYFLPSADDAPAAMAGAAATASSAVPSPAMATATPPVAAQPSVPARPSPDADLEWRTGIVREFESKRRPMQIVLHGPDGSLRFTQNDVLDAGWTPSKKEQVEYALKRGGGVWVRKPRR